MEQIDILKNDRIIFLKDNLRKIQTAQTKNDIFLVCELFEEYGKYESDFTSKIVQLERQLVLK